MSVIRVHKNKNFTVMSNTHLNDKNLSLKAIGLLSKMLSLPDSWDYTIAGLVAVVKDGESSVKSALKELRENYYVVIEKIAPNKDRGTSTMTYEYHVFENPKDGKECFDLLNNGELKSGSLGVVFQGIEKLGVEKQEIENHGQLNTNTPSTYKTNTDAVNTDELNTDNNSFSNEKDNSKTKVLDIYNSPVSEEKQETRTSKTLGRKAHTPKQAPLKDMATRAREIADRLVDDTETADKVSDCISYFLEQYKTHRRKEHIHLTNDRLNDVVVTMLSTITIEHENNGGMFENDYNPLVSDNVDIDDMKLVINQYFQTQFREKTDYSLVHFTQDGVLTNVMNKCMLGGNPWYQSHGL